MFLEWLSVPGRALGALDIISVMNDACMKQPHYFVHRPAAGRVFALRLSDPSKLSLHCHVRQAGV